MTNGSYDTIVASWALALKEVLEERGLDGPRFFKQFDINVEELDTPRARVNSGDLNKAFLRAVEVTGDQALGLEIADRAHPSSWHALGYALFASGSLQSFFGRLERYFKMLSSAAVMGVEREDGNYLVYAQPTFSGIAPARVDAFSATVLRFCRMSFGSNFLPLRMSLCRSTPVDTAPYEKVFQCPLEFDAPRIEWLITQHDMEKKLAAGNKELARRNDDIVKDYIARLDEDSFIPKVQTVIVECMSDGQLKQGAIAARLGVSVRGLQRKLADNGHSFSGILTSVRKEMALGYLDSGYQIKEIAFLLGFTDSSNFARAFKQWTGQAPTSIDRTTGTD